jgi:hypothetical protein
MASRRGAARAVRLICPRCAGIFTVVAFIAKGIDAASYWRSRAQEHDCEAHAKRLAAMRAADGAKNPLKASKAAARGKK